MTHLIVALLTGLPLYTVFCLLRPTKSCRRCGGWGSKPGRRRRAARRQCSRCDSTGRRFRRPARTVYAIRGAMVRHSELTARSAVRAARITDGTPRPRQERP